MADAVFQGDMDPELAALLGGGADADTDTLAAGDGPAGDDLESGDFDEDDSGDSGGEAAEVHVDMSAVGLPKVTKRFEAVPHEYFSDPNYYKAAISGEGDISQRVHGLLQKYLNTKDPKDRSVFRQQIIPAFWEFFGCVGRRAPMEMTPPKRFLLRFALLHPALLNAETKEFFSKLVTENELNQPVYYLDEWLRGIGTDAISPSTTDEVQVARGNVQARMQQLLDKANGKFDGAKTMLLKKNGEREALESALKDQLKIIFEKMPMTDPPGVNSPYNEGQKRTFAVVQETLKTMLKSDHELSVFIKDYRQARTDVQTLKGKVESGEGAAETALDLQALDTEFGTMRQVAKMTIGRKGNHFPILSGEYFHCGPNDVGFRENVLTLLAQIESIDPEVFCRVYKNRMNRIVPYVVLLPTYGDLGVCWEPFDKHNRATSRGRILVPMYPKNLYIALLSAVADLRWQVAKEKASFYWMEEGLTGNYYQWFAAQKLKGDVKEFFIQDYILWMTKEAEGIQKLDKDVRGAFWRFMPFAPEVKEKLKNRSFVYQELCQRDANRAMSTGY